MATYRLGEPTPSDFQEYRSRLARQGYRVSPAGRGRWNITATDGRTVGQVVQLPNRQMEVRTEEPRGSTFRSFMDNLSAEIGGTEVRQVGRGTPAPRPRASATELRRIDLSDTRSSSTSSTTARPSRGDRRPIDTRGGLSPPQRGPRFSMEEMSRIDPARLNIRQAPDASRELKQVLPRDEHKRPAGSRDALSPPASQSTTTEIKRIRLRGTDTSTSTATAPAPDSSTELKRIDLREHAREMSLGQYNRLRESRGLPPIDIRRPVGPQIRGGEMGRGTAVTPRTSEFNPSIITGVRIATTDPQLLQSIDQITGAAARRGGTARQQ